MRRRALLLVALVALAACGSDAAAPATSSFPGATEESSVASTASTVPTTTVPTTTVPTTTVAAATTAPTATTTTLPCQGPTGTQPVSVGFPDTLSSLIGRDIRTGSHPCFERVVLELQGDGAMPGYRVQYVDDPVRLSPSDLEVDIAGDATLVLSVGAWMTTMEGEGYQGPVQIEPTNVEFVRELRLIENFEGMHQWAIGLDRVRPFSVTTLTDPPRIVVDIGR